MRFNQTFKTVPRRRSIMVYNLRDLVENATEDELRRLFDYDHIYMNRKREKMLTCDLINWMSDYVIEPQQGHPYESRLNYRSFMIRALRFEKYKS